jgi:beta-glucosidase
MKNSSIVSLLSLGTVALASENYTDYILSSGAIKLGIWQTAYDKAEAFVSTLTTAEKSSIISGGDAGNFSALAMLDSSSNPLTYYFVTTWPAGLAMAMTWNQSTIEAQGAALGAEYGGKGISLAYAPTLEPLGRSAWCGRTGETYGPDSYFAGKAGGSL